jgi:hypothetical protein
LPNSYFKSSPPDVGGSASNASGGTPCARQYVPDCRVTTIRRPLILSFYTCDLPDRGWYSRGLRRSAVARSCTGASARLNRGAIRATRSSS